MARIYTRTGDRGETALLGGTRTTKADPRVDLYGGVDELNSHLGVARAQIAVSGEGGPAEPLQPLDDILLRIQRDLLELGALLADPERSADLRDADAGRFPWSVADLEGAIDTLQSDLPALKSFILPGGGAPAAALHVARTVCRRVERRAVAAAQNIALPAEILVYLNRLSDLLFVAARWANHRLGRDDVIWPERS